jgi:hypothetical protein
MRGHRHRRTVLDPLTAALSRAVILCPILASEHAALHSVQSNQLHLSIMRCPGFYRILPLPLRGRLYQRCLQAVGCTDALPDVTVIGKNAGLCQWPRGLTNGCANLSSGATQSPSDHFLTGFTCCQQ